MNTLSTDASIKRSLLQQKKATEADSPSIAGLLGRSLSVSLQLAILTPLAPAILLAWAVYWCVDGESLEQASHSTTTAPASPLPRIFFNSDVPLIGAL